MSREHTLRTIAESHRRFLDSKMFERFSKAHKARPQSIADQFKERGILVSTTILELREPQNHVDTLSTDPLTDERKEVL